MYSRLYTGFWHLKKATILFLNMFNAGLVGAGYEVDPRRTSGDRRHILLIFPLGDAGGSRDRVLL